MTQTRCRLVCCGGSTSSGWDDVASSSSHEDARMTWLPDMDAERERDRASLDVPEPANPVVGRGELDTLRDIPVRELLILQ
jgi:hypothetical protein